MKNTLIIFIVACLFATCTSKKAQNQQSVTKNDDFVERSLETAKEHLANAITQYQDLSQFPRSTNADGTLHVRGAKDWTSGFFPGSLWYMYEYTNDSKFKDAAINWTEAVSENQFNTGTHDVGFIINCSYGNGKRLTGNDTYDPIMVQTAKSLMTRYNKNVGCTKSWDWSKTWQFPVIIDNMMNMELLFEASKISGDDAYRLAAIDHSKTTMKNHFRADNSSYHVVDYDPSNGAVLEKVTHQGISAESAWARGQAWGLYGYTVCFRETKDQTFLDQADLIAAFIINHPETPEDLIPYWDYDAPGIPNEPRDASAAAIVASALLELSNYSKENSELYFTYAEKLLKNLSTDEYLAKPGSNNNFLLKHCTGHKTADSEVDGPLVYGDYYFLEALLRYKKMKS